MDLNEWEKCPCGPQETHNLLHTEEEGSQVYPYWQQWLPSAQHLPCKLVIVVEDWEHTVSLDWKKIRAVISNLLWKYSQLDDHLLCLCFNYFTSKTIKPLEECRNTYQWVGTAGPLAALSFAASWPTWAVITGITANDSMLRAADAADAADVGFC